MCIHICIYMYIYIYIYVPSFADVGLGLARPDVRLKRVNCIICYLILCFNCNNCVSLYNYITIITSC